MADAVGAALYDRADIDDDAVDRKAVRADIAHDLTVEQHGQDTHRHVDKEGGKAGDDDLLHLQQHALRAHQPQRAFTREKVRQHDKEGDRRADRGRKACAEDAHIAGEYEEVVTEDVENAACEHACGRKTGVAVVAQEGCQHLVKQEKRHNELDRQHIALREREQRIRRAEQPQHGHVEKRDHDPPQRRKDHRQAERGGEILVFVLVAGFPAAAQRGEQHRAADARQQAEAVDDVPNRRDDRERRRAVRTLVLADHRHVHDAVDRAGQRAAERRRQIAEVQRFDPVFEKIQISHPFPFAVARRAAQKKKPDKTTGVPTRHLIRLIISSE